VITLGVIADTHVPDRARRLNPGALSIFEQAGVQAILHAGDVCVPSVLAQLEEIAPTYAVRGNRDWVRLGHLPRECLLEFGGVNVALAHGHGDLAHYLADKVWHVLEGLQRERYWRRLIKSFPTARVIVFGHVHMSMNMWLDGRLLFNPGSACCPHYKQSAPSVGLVHIHTGGKVEGEIVNL